MKRYNYEEIEEITEEEVKNAVKFMANWKSPGQDNIRVFWTKEFDYIHKYLIRVYNEWMKNWIYENEIIGKTKLIYNG